MEGSESPSYLGKGKMYVVPLFLPTIIVCLPPGNSKSHVSLQVFSKGKGIVVTYSLYEIGTITPFYRGEKNGEREEKHKERK